MQFINTKQAYPLVFGIVLTLVGMGVWQKSNIQTVRAVPAPLPVVVAQSASPKISTRPHQGHDQIGTLRVSNQTEHPVRIILLLRGVVNGEPLSWDFAPGEGGKEGLQLSMPKDQIKIKSGDVIVAFATDGSRAYWGPSVVGDPNKISWQSDRREWNLIIQP
jgi:hypothetical protein